MGFWVWGVGCGVLGLRVGVEVFLWGFGFEVWGSGFFAGFWSEVWGSAPATPESRKCFALQTASVRTKVDFQTPEPSGTIDFWRPLPRIWLSVAACPGMN